MGGFEVAEVFVIKNLEEHAVGMPWRAAADEFAVGCAQRIENSVIEFLVVSYEIELVSVYHVKCGSTDCFRVVWESFYAASIGKVDLGFLRLKRNPQRKLPAIGGYACYDALGLPPRWPNYADCNVWVFHSVLQQECGYRLRFAALSTPTGSSKLVILKYLCELFLVAIGLKTQDLLKKLSGVIA